MGLSAAIELLSVLGYSADERIVKLTSCHPRNGDNPYQKLPKPVRVYWFAGNR